MCTAVLHTLVAGLLARSQYPEGPATSHFDTGFSWFPCVYKRMLRWLPTLQVATACFSRSPPDLNFLDLYCIFMYKHYNHCHRATAHLQLNIYYYYKSVKRFSFSHLIVTGINTFSNTELNIFLFNIPPEDEIGRSFPKAVSCSQYWKTEKSFNQVIIGS